jgi:hypothetical protein
VFQPEVAAEGIHWAAHHRRRELWVGGPTVQTILGERLAPWLVERVLTRKGYSGQLRSEATQPDRPANLFEPPPGDFGTHGVFDKEASPYSRQLWAAMHREKIVVIAAGVLILIWLLA